MQERKKCSSVPAGRWRQCAAAHSLPRGDGRGKNSDISSSTGCCAVQYIFKQHRLCTKLQNVFVSNLKNVSVLNCKIIFVSNYKMYLFSVHFQYRYKQGGHTARIL